MRSFTSWWKKRRNYYVTMQPDDSSGEKAPDVTMEDVDSDREGTPIRGNKPHYGGASVNSSPLFDVASMHSPSSLTTPETTPETIHFIHSSTPPSTDKNINELLSPSKMFRSATSHMAQTSTSPLLTMPTPAVRRSFSSGSLESMDSLVESYWDPGDVEEDSSSQITPVATNGHLYAPDFFTEHVHFLRVQTRPRKVEVVWSDTT